MKRTETMHNNTHPEWNEELQFIVDDPDTQAISVVVKDDDVLSDTVSLAAWSATCQSCCSPILW